MAWVAAVFSQLLWNILLLTFHGLRAVSWLYQGIYSRRSKNRQLDAYSGTVQCLHVIARFKSDLVLQPAGLDNFLLIHDSWRDPEVVLDDCVTLYYITQTEAVFVQCLPDIDVTSSRVASFMRIGQFRHASKVLIVPFHVFQRLADGLREPPGELVFVSNTTRCGSTLICQIFEETRRAVAMSEPDSLNAVNVLQGLPAEEYDRAVKNIVKVLCKPSTRHRNCSMWVLKMTMPTIVYTEYFSRAFPRAHLIFMYRDGLPTIMSLDRTARQLPLLDMVLFMGKLSPSFTKYIVGKKMGLPTDQPPKFQSRLQFCTHVWCMALDQFRSFRAKGVNVVGIRYEDLVADSEYVVSALFAHCGVPVGLAGPAARRGMARDSQQNSPLSRDRLRLIRNEALTPAVRALCDAVCAAHCLPRVQQPCVMDGTIGHKGSDPRHSPLHVDRRGAATVTT